MYSLLPLYLEKDVYQYLNVNRENSSMRTIIKSLFFKNYFKNTYFIFQIVIYSVELGPRCGLWNHCEA